MSEHKKDRSKVAKRAAPKTKKKKSSHLINPSVTKELKKRVVGIDPPPGVLPAVPGIIPQLHQALPEVEEEEDE